MNEAGFDQFIERGGRPAARSTPVERQAAMLSELVADGSLTQMQADAFTAIHNRLAAAGLMD